MAELNSIEQAEGILNPIEQLDADFDFDVYTKQEVDALLDEKADADAVYTKTETNNLLNGKADADSVYTKTETDTLLSAKADKSTTLAGYGITDAYTKTQTDNLLNGKADADSVYTKQEIDTKIPSSVGSATKPIYVNGGVLTECTYELNKTVPANAVFTDTTYTAGNGLNLSSSTFSAKAGTNVIVDSGGINVNGTGAVASADSGLLNGGTAFAELRPTLDGTWVKNAQTTATNLQRLEGGIEYLYGLLSHQYDQLKKYINGNYYDYDTDTDSSYTKTVPQGAMPYASIEQIGGRTLVWNQLVDSGTTTVATISGHKYYTLIDGTASIVTSDGTAISVVDDTADMVCDLTLMFGSGNEPTTVEEFTAQFPAQYYPYNAGTLLSAGVTEVVSKKADTTEIATYPIPASIQALEGYGWSAGTKKNYIDFNRKVYVQEVGKIVMNGTNYHLTYDNSGNPNGNTFYYAYFPFNKLSSVVCDKFLRSNVGKTSMPLMTFVSNSGANATIYFCLPSTVTTTAEANAWFEANPTTIYYALSTPIETDISAYLTDDNLISVEAGGSLTFPNSNGDDYRIEVPSSETYMIDLQEAL